MTGTSLDGLDVALVEVEGSWLDMRIRLVAGDHEPLGALGDQMQSLASGSPASASQFVQTGRLLGELHAMVVDRLCRGHLPRGARLAFVAAHGQTICHLPPDASRSAEEAHTVRPGLTWQLLDPWPIARKLTVPVCYDFRQADVVAGGQGAPITPMADWIMFRSDAFERIVVNLGGICNVTILDPKAGGSELIDGGDVCPCNILIDGVVRRLFRDQAFDRDGRIAAEGRPDEIVFELIQQHPFFHRRGRQSIGRDDFSDAWLHALIRKAGEQLSPADIVASTVDAVAREIGRRVVASSMTSLILAGGGARNPVLVDRIRHHSQAGDIKLSDELGIPCELREAAAMAVLAALCQDDIVISLPHITGSRRPGTAGAWIYP